MPPSVKVTGTCPKCRAAHARTAAPGRKTWRGTCNRNGCDGQIYLRMARTAAAAPPADPDQQPPPAPPAAARKGVPRGSYQRRPADAGRRSGSDVPAAPAADRSPDGRRDEPERDHDPDEQPVGGRTVRRVEPETGNTGRHPYAHLPYFR